MKLRRLEISGFKSFAQKVMLEFPDRISAIVGPNGSGKSNLADAIRWVLGEQGQRQIRVEAPTDVIFAGSKIHGRMSAVAVKVEFEDPSDVFGLGASQAVFERRLSRDGVGEFFINKSSARLKDIVLYLTRAKAGVKGISVVNQGAVDAILSASSRERYEMILETLGLKELEIKKNDSLKKLDDTRANLKEVRARREEISPHLKLLRREKEKAGERSELAKRLKIAEESFFFRAFHNLGIRRKEIESDRESAKLLVSDIRQRIFEKESEIGAAKEEVEGEAKSKESRLLEEKEKLIYRISQIEAEIKYGTTVRVVNYREKLEELLRALRSLLVLSELNAVREQISSLIKEFEEFLSERETVQKSALFEEKAEVAQKIKELETEISSLKRGSGESGAFAKIFNEYKILQDQLSEAKAKLASLEHQADKLREQELKLEDFLKSSPVLDFGERSVFKAAEKEESGFDERGREEEIVRLRGELRNLGETDREVLEEAEKTISRFEFLEKETKDLRAASRDLIKMISELDSQIKKSFKESLSKISEEFNNYMRAIFGGGRGKIFIKRIIPKAKETEESGDGEEVKTTQEKPRDEEAEEVIEIDVSLPNKKIRTIESLSGGERALTSIALLFALVKVSEPPFLVLDEVDAALDEVNALKFIKILKDLTAKTQFILITHNRQTIENAEVLYGVTMQQGVSKVISLKLVEAEALANQNKKP